jgi:2-polyprenyl-6-methoxyphenol hydroxylase-like FAD-dependent oxidoreductase
MKNQRILISGAGVAGPSLAYWLAYYGYTPTIVERAPAVRQGGQAVDFRGPAHLGVLEQMNILDEIRRHASPGGAVAFVDRLGRGIATMAAEMASGDVEILRGELGGILYAATRENTEYLFGDWITAIEQTSEAVRVTFARNAAREFDLVIGADGLHSTVRSLAFGAEAQFVRYLGYHVAIASVEKSHGSVAGTDGGWLYSEPGRTAGVVRAGNAARAIFYFASPPLQYDRHDAEQQKRLVADTFAGVGWETPRLVSAMRSSTDFYFDAISEVRMPRLSTGRIALVGDAGYGGTIGGMGTGVAVVAAYVLAGELAAADGDHVTAFARYEERVRDYVARCQRGARSVGKFMAPRTRLGIVSRNLFLRVANMLPGKGFMERIAMQRASDVTFGDYPRRGIVSNPTIMPAISGGP